MGKFQIYLGCSRSIELNFKLLANKIMLTEIRGDKQ